MGATIAHESTGERRGSLLDWVTTTNHKKIGLLYIGTTFFFFLLGGINALLMRTELARPGLQFLSKTQFNELFTIHGTTMIFLFIAPMGLGLANYFVPLQIGAPDMAFPRLNMLSYWLFLGAGLTIYASFLAPGGAAQTGWTFYAPLSDKLGSPGPGADMWIMGVLLASTSSIMTGVNLMATIFMLRAPGMTMWRISLFCWNMIITSLMILVAFPPLAGALALMFIDRHFGGHFFDPSGGGSAVLYQHLFWFFGHPEVYIMILPFFGIVTDIIPVFSRKPIFGYTGFVLASMSIAGLSMTVWAHHMFTTGAVLNPFFSIMSFLIAVPTGIKFFNWIGTMRRVADHLPTSGAGLSLTTPNLVATIGSYVMAIGAILFLVNVYLAFKRKVPAGDDPWGGYTLEWITSSPPPEHNFHWLPPIRSERPVFDWRHREHPAVKPRA